MRTPKELIIEDANALTDSEYKRHRINKRNRKSKGRRKRAKKTNRGETWTLPVKRW